MAESERETAPGLGGNILIRDPPLQIRAVVSWRGKIMELLNRHMVQAPDSSQLAIFLMQGEDGKFQSWTLTAVRGANPH